MAKRLVGLMCVCILALTVGCGVKVEKTSADGTKTETVIGEEKTLDIATVNNWYIGEIWNPITSFRDYIESGTDSSGEQFDADFAYDKYTKALEKKDEYTTFIHDNYPDIASTWDKMMEQVDIINKNLDDGYEVGSEEINTDLLSQYGESFYEYCNSL